MLDSRTQIRVHEVEQRLRDRGVVDIKFFKDRVQYLQLTPSQQVNQLCDVVEAMLDGKSSLAAPFGDSVRSLHTLSPVTRCGGGRLGEDHNEEEQQKGGTAAP